jgi:hypothetical protein
VRRHSDCAARVKFRSARSDGDGVTAKHDRIRGARAAPETLGNNILLADG